MMNPAPEIRRTLYTLLNGTIVYNGATIQVYEGEDSPVLQYKILLGDYSDSGQANKHGFRSQASQVIEIVAEQPTGIKKHVDAIGELVSQHIHPDPRSTLWSTSNITVVMDGKPGIRHLIEESGERTKIVRLILRYNMIILNN